MRFPADKGVGIVEPVADAFLLVLQSAFDNSIKASLHEMW